MLADIRALHIFDKGIHLGDASIGDDIVEVVDTLIYDGLGDVERRLLDTSVILDHDDTASLACGQLGELQGGWVSRVSNCSDDGLG